MVLAPRACRVSSDLRVQRLDELPKRTFSPLVVLLALSHNPLKSQQQACRLEVPEFQLCLVVPDVDPPSDLARVKHVAAAGHSVGRFEPVSATEDRFRDLADLLAIGSVRDL